MLETRKWIITRHGRCFS